MVLRWLPWIALAQIACSRTLPAPALTAHPSTAYFAVPYPPPAALAETVPERPGNADVVWIDGEWIYRGQSFVWSRGGWVAPPLVGRFAPWRVWYQNDGRLMMAAGTWYDSSHKPLPAPETVTPAFTPLNEFTPEDQVAR
ncbi:MAG: hypothetical protein RJA70_933 [Pseudomonadota bacterium]|jgi:hypothetical protein